MNELAVGMADRLQEKKTEKPDGEGERERVRGTERGEKWGWIIVRDRIVPGAKNQSIPECYRMAKTLGERESLEASRRYISV